MAAATASNSTSNRVDNIELKYLIVSPEKGGTWDLLKYMVFGDITSFGKFLESGNNGEGEYGLAVLSERGSDRRWVILVSIIVRKVLAFLSKPLEITGYVVDFILNLLSLNGELLGLICNIVHGIIT